jgi:hypothetical protein
MQAWIVRVASYLSVGAGAALWMSGSMVVAFPEDALSLHYAPISEQFLQTPWHPASLLALLLIDIGIAIGLLKDFRVRDGLSAGNRLAVVVFALLIFLILAIIVPIFNEPLIEVHPLIVVGLALGCLALLRAMSYAPPQRARPVGPAGGAGPGDGGPR